MLAEGRKIKSTQASPLVYGGVKAELYPSKLSKEACSKAPLTAREPDGRPAQEGPNAVGREYIVKVSWKYGFLFGSCGTGKTLSYRAYPEPLEMTFAPNVAHALLVLAVTPAPDVVAGWPEESYSQS